MNLVDELHAIAAALVQAGVRHAVCGGVAGSLAGCLAGATKVDLPEGPLVVVSRDVLLRMKRQAGRAQDLADLDKLEATEDE